MGGPVAVNGAIDNARGSGDDASRPAHPAPVPARQRIRHLSLVVVVVVGLLITVGLSVGARALNNSNEDRLLRQRVREVGVVAAAAIPNIQTPLATAAVLAETTNGNPVAFRALMLPIVKAGQPFSSASLWSTRSASPRPLAVVGAKPELATEGAAAIRRLLERAQGSGAVAVNDLLSRKDRRLGYALTVPRTKARYVVYGEAKLPTTRRAQIDQNSAFSDLGYALYLGTTPNPQSLLASSTGGALLHGRRASATVPFGDSSLLVVMTPNKELGGPLLARLWWILALLGFALTLGAATLVERISRRRNDAELLAIENARLYAQQRSVAQTLQHSLLAEAFPEIGGLEFAASYVAGVEGIDIGGDWYDVVRLERGNIMLIVGDVSGRGLEAATMMASLRFSARAYGAEGHPPTDILTRLSGLVNIGRDGHFATVLCGLLDVATGRVTIANAGHPEPLLIGPDGATFVKTNIGVPVGVTSDQPYTETEFSFPRGSTLLLYTDGAIERRGERLDAGLARLERVSLAADGSLVEFLAKVVDGVTAEDAEDDTAFLGVRWRD